MDGTSTETWAASKSDSPLLHDGMMIWNNLAFGTEEVDDEEVVYQQNCSSPPARGAASDHEGSVVIKHVVEEEDQDMKFREELEKELEKQLEQQIMVGILDLVRKLSNLKAKMIVRSLKKLDVDDLLSVLDGSSFDISCKDGNNDDGDVYGSPKLGSEHISSPSNVRQHPHESEEEVLECSKKESRLKRSNLKPSS